MGEISRRLHRKLTKLIPPGDKTRPPKGWRPQTPAQDIPNKTTDTLAECLIEANDSICMNPDQYQADAIYLSGIPDLTATLPHA